MKINQKKKEKLVKNRLNSDVYDNKVAPLSTDNDSEKESLVDI